MMVADTGPLIAFARLGRLPLLHQVVADVIVPEAVYDELVTKGRGKPGAAEVAQESWIRREAIRHRDALAHFPATLAHGEREAIVLAEALHATLLMDDGRAREVAEQRGVEVVGSLWVLGEAKRCGFIPAVPPSPLVEELLAMGYWMHPERVIRPFLQEMNESSSVPDRILTDMYCHGRRISIETHDLSAHI